MEPNYNIKEFPANIIVEAHIPLRTKSQKISCHIQSNCVSIDGVLCYTPNLGRKKGWSFRFYSGVFRPPQKFLLCIWLWLAAICSPKKKKKNFYNSHPTHKPLMKVAQKYCNPPEILIHEEISPNFLELNHNHADKKTQTRAFRR